MSPEDIASGLDQDNGASPLATGLSQAEPKVSALRASIPSAVDGEVRSSRTPASTMSFAWSDDGSIAGRALALARSMAATKCKNKFPVGVIGREARAHYTEARHIASAIEARQGQDRADGLGAQHESAVAQPDAHPSSEQSQ